MADLLVVSGTTYFGALLRSAWEAGPVLTTRFTELVGCSKPIQQAPIGSVATPALAVAVANAGGLGSIAALGIKAASLDAMLAEMTSGTSGPLAVNFVTNDVDRDA